MRNFFLVAMAALSLTACRQNDSLVESDSNFGMSASSADYSVGCTAPVQTISGNINSSNGIFRQEIVEILQERGLNTVIININQILI